MKQKPIVLLVLKRSDREKRSAVAEALHNAGVQVSSYSSRENWFVFCYPAQLPLAKKAIDDLNAERSWNVKLFTKFKN